MLCELLLIGDSLMVGFGSHSFPNSLNLGRTGSTTVQLLREAETDLKACPGDVLIQVGVNEIGGDLPEIAERTERLTQVFTSEGHKVYLLAIPSACRWQSKVDALNILYSKIPGVTFIPLPPTLRAHLYTDCIHLNPSGYKVWVPFIQNYLNK